ncbi:hypothetical protein BHM03_00033928 [Ensete ventricosum]|nr:hypothetical protein BHM03_00033928 [Ensete ventricosum]
MLAIVEGEKGDCGSGRRGSGIIAGSSAMGEERDCSGWWLHGYRRRHWQPMTTWLAEEEEGSGQWALEGDASSVMQEVMLAAVEGEKGDSSGIGAQPKAVRKGAATYGQAPYKGGNHGQATCRGDRYGQGRLHRRSTTAKVACTGGRLQPAHRKVMAKLWQGLPARGNRPSVTDNNVNKVFDEMLMFVHVLRFVYIPCTTSSRLAFNILLDLEGYSGDCIGEESQSSKCIYESRTTGMVVAETSSVTQEWVDEGELPSERTKNWRWRRPYDVLAKATHGEVIRLESWTTLVLTFAKGSPASQRTKPKMLGGHSGVEAGGRKGQGSDDESSGAQLPISKALVRKEVDSEEHHSAAEANLPITKEGMKMQGNR